MFHEQQTFMGSLCVFSGSNTGADEIYAASAIRLGQEMARNGVSLVYGGASVGLMGIIADTVLGAGGKVTGVIPRSLVDKEVAHHSLSDLRIVGSMHERKALMSELSDGFIALPGGLGTFEELFEIWTWAQLGSHTKPCAILNVRGYYDQLLGFLDHASKQGFLQPSHRDMLIVHSDPRTLLQRMASYRAPTDEKWIQRSSM